MNALGNVFIETRDYAAAQAVHEQNLKLASSVGDPLLIPDAQGMLSVALGSQEVFPAAYTLLDEALRRRLERGDKRNACVALRAAASLFAADNRGLQADPLWGALEALREREDALGLTLRQQAEYNASVERARSGSDAVQFAAAWQRGRALTWQQAVDHARSGIE